MPVKIDRKSIVGMPKRLLASEAIPGLQEHFNNPDNQRRFKEWQEKRREADNAIQCRRAAAN